MKKAIKIISFALALFLIFCINTIALADSYNSSSLYGSIKQKMARAESLTKSNKFIIIGGSASNLAFDSKVFEELSGMPAVNLAVSAGVPLRVYMKAAENCATAGDVIIMPLEYNYYSEPFYGVSEEYVDMVSIDSDLKCEETFFGNIDYYSTLFLRSFTKLNDCFMFALKENMQTDNTIYIADSVNEYGDFYLHKDREATYKRAVKDTTFEYDVDTLERINDFIERMEEKGVTVYLSYPTFDLQSVQDYEDYYTTAQKVVENNISSENIIGTPLDFAYDEDFFFDTIYHIKYENKSQYTKDLYRCYEETLKNKNAE